MSKQVQNIRGTTATEDARTLPVGCLSVDTDSNELRLHDGVTVGGHRILNSSQLVAFTSLEFVAVVNVGTPGNIADSNVGNFVNLTLAGTYNLPLLSAFDVGQRILIRPTVASVVLGVQGTDQITNQAADVTTVALSANEVLTLVKRTTTRFQVIGRY